jgi:arylsulfatase A-like enzyme
LFLHYTELHKNLVRAIVQKYELESNDDDYFHLQKENNERYNSYLPSADEYVSTLMNTIKELGIADKTILIIFSDHGTSIGEKKGEKFYGVFTYEYTINVFCFLCIPRIQSNVINKQCRTIDILPTIAELAGINSNELKNVQGESLLHLIKNKNTQERELFVETGGLYGPWPSPKKHNMFCVKIHGKKLIYNDTSQTWEFYDLKNDPNELHNIYDEHSKQINDLKKKLISYFKKNKIITKLNDNTS